MEGGRYTPNDRLSTTLDRYDPLAELACRLHTAALVYMRDKTVRARFLRIVEEFDRAVQTR